MSKHYIKPYIIKTLWKGILAFAVHGMRDVLHFSQFHLKNILILYNIPLYIFFLNLIPLYTIFFMILSFSNSEIRECVSLNKCIWSIIINTVWDIRPCTKKEGRNNKTNYKTKRTRHSFHLIYIWYRRIKTLSKNFSLEMQWIQSTFKFL